MQRSIATQIETIRHTLAVFFETNVRMVIVICIIVAVSFVLIYNFIFDSNRLSYSVVMPKTMSMIDKNKTLYLSSFSSISSSSLERDTDCNLNKTTSCYTANKSLVVTFWRDSSRNKWLAKNILRIFPDKNFVRIIMVHDNSTWSSYPDKELFIWIHVKSQKRFWYVKRFLTPPILKAYKYLWILDDDVELLFEPLHYECVATQLNISLSSPVLFRGIISHSITGLDRNFVDKIGRWTDFVEIGPMVVGSSLAWQCIWHFLSPFGGIGWGLDYIWCKLIAHNCGTHATMQKTCALLDVFKFNHLSNSIVSGALGGNELPAYNQYYKNFSAKRVNIAPLANNLAVYSSCTKN